MLDLARVRMFWCSLILCASVVRAFDAGHSTPRGGFQSHLNRGQKRLPRMTYADAKSSPLDERIYNFNSAIINTSKDIIDFFYRDNDYARFYVLETVARVPYFAYLSVMHLRETFGKREPGDGERMRTHYAEADNELHHLLIMESLGGNASAVDRTLAQTMAFGYYWYVTAVYAASEQAAYHLSELIEDHAYHTYDQFLTENEAELKTLPVPAIARKYYEEDDPFLFDLFCTVKEPSLEASPSSQKQTDGSSGRFSRTRPKLNSLYDVFVNVRNDEREHWKTLCCLVQFGEASTTGFEGGGGEGAAGVGGGMATGALIQSSKPAAAAASSLNSV
mmetsp:Transcript_2841/g.5093  ORF Transcript_2841/g.5093 Transcript_2841/m.5093 type:complete len:334 (-) Transcript_2841:448-1449(-)